MEKKKSKKPKKTDAAEAVDVPAPATAVETNGATDTVEVSLDASLHMPADSATVEEEVEEEEARGGQAW